MQTEEQILQEQYVQLKHEADRAKELLEEKRQEIITDCIKQKIVQIH